MPWQRLIDRIHELCDLELAVLLCLIAREHCIVETDPAAVDDLEQELQLVVSNLYGLSHAVVSCTERTTIDEFGNSILTRFQFDDEFQESNSHNTQSDKDSNLRPGFGSRSKSRSPLRDSKLDDRRVVNVVIARNFDIAPEEVQIQALELLRTKRIFTRTAVHPTPKVFLFIPLISSGGSNPRLNRHLNDHIFISHYHDPDDGFPYLESDSGWLSDEKASISSVKRRKSTIQIGGNVGLQNMIREEEIDLIRQRSDDAKIAIEVKQYLQNITVFLRLNRAVAGGVSSRATTHFDLLVKCLAPLHSLLFITPSLVILAARKIYPHRIRLVAPEDDRSLQYGSDLRVVAALLRYVTPESVIEDVLAAVEAPL